MSAQAAEVDAVFDAVEQIITSRLTKLRRQYERATAKGLQPHMVVANKAERVEYVRNSLREVRAQVLELADAAAYALRTRDDAGALSDTAEHNLREALADLGRVP